MKKEPPNSAYSCNTLRNWLPARRNSNLPANTKTGAAQMALIRNVSSKVGRTDTKTIFKKWKKRERKIRSDFKMDCQKCPNTLTMKTTTTTTVLQPETPDRIHCWSAAQKNSWKSNVGGIPIKGRAKFPIWGIKYQLAAKKWALLKNKQNKYFFLFSKST